MTLNQVVPTPVRTKNVPARAFVGSRFKTFQPKLDLKAITRRKIWKSHTGASMPTTMANLVVLRHLRQHGWAEGFRLWCGLTFLTHELYQYKPRGQAALFFLVLGHLGDVLVLCSFEGKKACKSMVYQPMTAHDPDKLDPVVQPELRAVTSVTDWSAIPTQVKAPLTAQLLHKYKGDLPPGIVLFQHSGTCSVWKHAAQMGFRSVPEHVCREIANECQREAPVGYIPLVVTLLKHFLHPISNEECARILQESVEFMEGPSELLKGADVDDVLDIKEKTEREESRRQQEEKKQESKLLLDEMATWFESHKKSQGSNRRSSKAKSSSASSSGSGKKRWTAPPLETEWAREMVRGMGPQTLSFSMGRTPGQGRWFATYGDAYKSFSWRLWGGESSCVKMCLQWAWMEHERETGEPCTFDACPVDGLFD